MIEKKSEDALPQAATATVRHITQNELPLFCPTADQRVWDAHPRVYLAITPTAPICCPYCGTTYILTASHNVHF